MSFNTRKISSNSLQSSQPQSQNLKSSQVKASQQSTASNNPFKQAVSRNPFLKPQKNASSQPTTGNDNDDYEGEGDEDTNLSNTKKNSKLREIISIDRFNGKVIKKWVPIEEDGREFRRSTLNEVENNNRKSVFSRHKSTLGADNYTVSQSPKNTQQGSQGRKGDILSQNTVKSTQNNNFISPEKFNNNDFKSTQDNQQNLNNSLLRQSINARAEQNEFQSPNPKYTINHSPLRYELGSDNNRHNTTKFNNFDSPTKRIKRPQDSTQVFAKRNAGFDTQSPLEFPNPDPSLSPIKDYLIEWAQAENLTQPTHDFLKLQPNLTSWQRASLINWIPKLYSKLNFGKGQNYYLIVRLIDRALGIKQLPKK
ncbi:hypothetical protein CONCODRAFT_129996 [Conidiobolus coronatus NRRL 28638]|uniref:Uncharacterized protein n=1 Tax=Conidiobolus coronatus (strain ATCC 28846 / CBS 209.66 / NRRL 28638) TaxID=796925 RepID=A0A137NU59_CONC2|nr:hypothetical protein CONCODRAFT_129996 [Conidiobolus coronatus NRRL 28638]|eukprot:KXN66289.1 hypothetical protein CONCODRAFT_129996 [Conidiobolus coronatus NRRL 28638]